MYKLYSLFTIFFVHSLASAYVPATGETGILLLPFEHSRLNVGSVAANFINDQSVAELKFALEQLDTAATELGTAIAKRFDTPNDYNKIRVLYAARDYFRSQNTDTLTEYILDHGAISKNDLRKIGKKTVDVINELVETELPSSFIEAIKKSLYHFERCTQLRYDPVTSPKIGMGPLFFDVWCNGPNNVSPRPEVLELVHSAFAEAAAQSDFAYKIAEILPIMILNPHIIVQPKNICKMQPLHAYICLMKSLYVSEFDPGIKKLQAEINLSPYRPIVTLLDSIIKSLEFQWAIHIALHPMSHMQPKTKKK